MFKYIFYFQIHDWENGPIVKCSVICSFLSHEIIIHIPYFSLAETLGYRLPVNAHLWPHNGRGSNTASIQVRLNHIH